MNASKEEKRACPVFVLDSKSKEDDKSFCKVWASKLAESDKGSYYNQVKWLKDDKASEKHIETSAKSSFTSFLASGAFILGRKAAERETNSRQVPRHIKIRRRIFLKVYCNGRAASRKTPCRKRFVVDFSRVVSNFSKMYRVKVGLAQNENCPLQITKDAFSTTKGSNRAERLK